MPRDSTPCPSDWTAPACWDGDHPYHHSALSAPVYWSRTPHGQLSLPQKIALWRTIHRQAFTQKSKETLQRHAEVISQALWDSPFLLERVCRGTCRLMLPCKVRSVCFWTEKNQNKNKKQRRQKRKDHVITKKILFTLFTSFGLLSSPLLPLSRRFGCCTLPPSSGDLYWKFEPKPVFTPRR